MKLGDILKSLGKEDIFKDLKVIETKKEDTNRKISINTKRVSKTPKE